MTALPVLYSFRRCPYAMRARWALWVAGQAVEHREILLRDKPAALLQASPKGTVPVLVLPDGTVIDESLAVMRWALARHDPEQWLQPERESLAAMLNDIADCQTRFKPHLDRSKYPQRHADELRAWAARDGAVATAVAEPDPRAVSQAGAPSGSPAGSAHTPGLVGAEFRTERHAAVLAAYVAAQHALAGAYLQALNARLDEGGAHLFGERPALADFAIAPFVRQYAAVDAARWASGPWPALRAWLAGLLARPEFEWAVMRKVPVWQAPTSGAAS